MKKIMLFILLYIGAISYGQEISVPDVVLNSFKEKYPEAAKARWELKSNNYVVNFSDTKQKQASFDADGKWLRSFTLLTKDDIPEVITEYLSEEYLEYEVKECKLVEISDGSVNYHVKLVNEDNEKMTVKFTEEGEFLE